MLTLNFPLVTRISEPGLPFTSAVKLNVPSNQFPSDRVIVKTPDLLIPDPMLEFIEFRFAMPTLLECLVDKE